MDRPNVAAEPRSVATDRPQTVSIAVLIPCRDEAATIHKVIADFQAALPDARILVFDNNSTDQTREIAAAAGAEVRAETLQGKGHVVRRMFADVDADVYVLVDGDDTYDAVDTGRLVDALRAQTLDLVNGRRVTDATLAYRPGHRFGNQVLTGLVAFVFGKGLDDMLSGCKIMSRRFVKSFPCLSTGFEIETEIVVHALSLMLPMAELPVAYRERPMGSTSKLNTWRDGLRILRLIIRLTRFERPTAFFGLIFLLLAALSTGLGLPLIVTFIETGLVPRLPTAVLASSLMLLAMFALFSGLILEMITRGRREAKRLAYLQYATVSETRLNR